MTVRFWSLSTLAAHAWAIAMLLVCAATWFLATAAEGPIPERAGLSDIQWRPSGSGEWRKGLPTSADTEGRVVVVRAIYDHVDAGAAKPPPQLVLSGPFSAEIRVNGRLVGVKGRPGLSAADEIAGPIDASAPLAGAVTGGPNHVLVLLSSHRAGYAPINLFHRLSVQSAGSFDRPLSMYGPALAQAGLLLLLTVAVGAAAVFRRDTTLAWCAGAGSLLTLALVAEVSRAFWNYPYDLHLVRMTLVWGLLSLFGLAAVVTLHRRLGRRATASIVVISILAAVLCSQIESIDARTRVMLTLLLTLGVVAVVGRGRTIGGYGLAVGAVMAFAALSLWVWPAFTLDNNIYLSGSAIIAGLTRPLLRPQAYLPDVRASASTLTLDNGERLWAHDIVWAKAAGNYVEVRLANGGRRLFRARLSDVADLPGLIRIHRSYAIRLDCAASVSSRTGSRYRVSLTNADQLPVGRNFLAALRRRLSERASRPPTLSPTL